MTYRDNPAFEVSNTNGNHHVDMWAGVIVAGEFGGSSNALRGWATDNGLLANTSESKLAMLAFDDADTDDDGAVIDNYVTTATAGTPGSWTPSDVPTPYNVAALNYIKPLPSPATDWTTGQRVVLQSGSTAHWEAAAVVITSGEADDETWLATAHGLSVGDIVIITALTGGTGASINTVYTVRAVADANHFTLSKSDGTALTISADASGITAYSGEYVTGNAT